MFTIKKRGASVTQMATFAQGLDRSKNSEMRRDAREKGIQHAWNS